MPHDEKDGFGIFARARAQKFGHENVAAKRADAKKLCEAVANAAVSAGYSQDVDKQGNTLIKPNRERSGAVWLTFNEDGVHVGYENYNVQQTRVLDPEIEYDVARGEWVGKSVDPSVPAVPGAQPVKRSAVAVVAEVVAEALAKVS
jgi:hypothetical protein